MQVILSVLFYFVFFCFTVVYFLIFCLAFILTVPFDKKRFVLHWLSWLWIRCYFGIIPTWKVSVEGLDKIDREETYIIVVNHRSMMDILLMYYVPLNFRWVAKKAVYKWPLFGWVLWMHGDIAIERGARSAIKKMINDGKKWMSKGVSVTIFPEGTRSAEDGVGRFKDGAFALAKSAGVPILPCVLSGTDGTFQSWRLNFRNKFHVRVLDPISADYVEASDTKELTAEVQELMAENYQEIKVKTK